jgi:hypothetical protein
VLPTIRDDPYANVKDISDSNNDGIYNHLNEKKNPEADLDDYDHAQPSTDHSAPDDYDHAHLSSEHDVPDEDYCHLKPDRKMTSQQNDVYDTATSVGNDDDYFTLEKE